MRTIKFRAWYAGEMEYDYISSENNYFDWGATNQNAYELHRQIELMQFTGLLDKNGKEIYEGDCWYHTDGLGNKRLEIAKYGSYGFEHDDEGIGYPLSHNVKTKKCYFEVIGNCFENPELLTK